MINPYEKIIKTIREEASRSSSGALSLSLQLQLGKMLTLTSVEIGELTFEKDELLFSEHLLHDIVTQVDEFHDTVVIDEQPVLVNNSESISKLQVGDTVLCYVVDDETCIIIDKVVSA